MSLRRVFEDHGYRPEYGTFVIRDVPGPDQVRHPVGGLLAEYAVETQPSGSLARAGDGWVEGVAADSHHTVRIEVYDAPPDDDDLSEWDDVLVTPFATSGVARLALVVGGPIGEPIRLGPPGVYRVLFARRPVVAGNDPEGWPCEYRLRFWPVDAPPEPPRWLRRSDLLVDGRPASERGAFDGSYRRAITDVVMLALWAAESATPLTLEWLADRLLTTTATVRAIIEHPRASPVLSIDGDLDDVNAPLAVTVIAKEPRDVRAVKAAALPPRPASAVRQSTPARRSTPARQSRPGVRGVRPVAARPAIRRQDAAEAQERDAADAQEGQAPHGRLDNHPGGSTDPEQAG
ncbi:MAG TPA: hypothetical protein VGJ07_05405 [Rugosimonospora sp.]